jgi:hypothetical protein
MNILSLDPSGSFKYGSGTTGWCIVNLETEKILEIGKIEAKNFKTKEEYFAEHIKLLDKEINIVIIENFILYQHTAQNFINQELETSELIGYIDGKATERNLNVVRQNAQLIKTALKKTNVLLKITNRKQFQLTFKTSKKDSVQWYFNNKRIKGHIVDAIRHAFYYINQSKEK